MIKLIELEKFGKNRIKPLNKSSFDLRRSTAMSDRWCPLHSSPLKCEIGVIWACYLM